MAGLRSICKLYGSIKATSADGKTVVHVWDYAADEPCLQSEMPKGSDRWKASEKAKWKAIAT
jgi:hypothetical protein